MSFSSLDAVPHGQWSGVEEELIGISIFPSPSPEIWIPR